MAPDPPQSVSNIQPLDSTAGNPGPPQAIIYLSDFFTLLFKAHPNPLPTSPAHTFQTTITSILLQHLGFSPAAISTATLPLSKFISAITFSLDTFAKKYIDAEENARKRLKEMEDELRDLEKKGVKGTGKKGRKKKEKMVESRKGIEVKRREVAMKEEQWRVMRVGGVEITRAWLEDVKAMDEAVYVRLPENGEEEDEAGGSGDEAFISIDEEEEEEDLGYSKIRSGTMNYPRDECYSSDDTDGEDGKAVEEFWTETYFKSLGGPVSELPPLTDPGLLKKLFAPLTPPPATHNPHPHLNIEGCPPPSSDPWKIPTSLPPPDRQPIMQSQTEEESMQEAEAFAAFCEENEYTMEYLLFRIATSYGCRGMCSGTDSAREMKKRRVAALRVKAIGELVYMGCMEPGEAARGYMEALRRDPALLVLAGLTLRPHGHIEVVSRWIQEDHEFYQEIDYFNHWCLLMADRGTPVKHGIKAVDRRPSTYITIVHTKTSLAYYFISPTLTNYHHIFYHQVIFSNVGSRIRLTLEDHYRNVPQLFNLLTGDPLTLYYRNPFGGRSLWNPKLVRWFQDYYDKWQDPWPATKKWMPAEFTYRSRMGHWCGIPDMPGTRLEDFKWGGKTIRKPTNERMTEIWQNVLEGVQLPAHIMEIWTNFVEFCDTRDVRIWSDLMREKGIPRKGWEWADFVGEKEDHGVEVSPPSGLTEYGMHAMIDNGTLPVAWAKAAGLLEKQWGVVEGGLQVLRPGVKLDVGRKDEYVVRDEVFGVGNEKVWKEWMKDMRCWPLPSPPKHRILRSLALKEAELVPPTASTSFNPQLKERKKKKKHPPSPRLQLSLKIIRLLEDLSRLSELQKIEDEVVNESVSLFTQNLPHSHIGPLDLVPHLKPLSMTPSELYSTLATRGDSILFLALLATSQHPHNLDLSTISFPAFFQETVYDLDPGYHLSLLRAVEDPDHKLIKLGWNLITKLHRGRLPYSAAGLRVTFVSQAQASHPGLTVDQIYHALNVTRRHCEFWGYKIIPNTRITRDDVQVLIAILMSILPAIIAAQQTLQTTGKETGPPELRVIVAFMAISTAWSKIGKKLQARIRRIIDRDIPKFLFAIHQAVIRYSRLTETHAERRALLQLFYITEMARRKAAREQIIRKTNEIEGKIEMAMELEDTLDGSQSPLPYLKEQEEGDEPEKSCPKHVEASKPPRKLPFSPLLTLPDPNTSLSFPLGHPLFTHPKARTNTLTLNPPPTIGELMITESQGLYAVQLDELGVDLDQKTKQILERVDKGDDLVKRRAKEGGKGGWVVGMEDRQEVVIASPGRGTGLEREVGNLVVKSVVDVVKK